MADDVQQQIQEKLAEAQRLLREAGRLADENGQGDLFFMGMVFEAHVGWFSPDGNLREPSTWNHSVCVIGSRYDKDYGNAFNVKDDWNDSGCSF